MRIGFERVFSHSFAARVHIARECQLKKHVIRVLLCVGAETGVLKEQVQRRFVFSLPARHKLSVLLYDWQLFKRFKGIKCSIFKMLQSTLTLYATVFLLRG